MNSRETILSRVRQQQVNSVELPTYGFTPPTDNLAERFCESLRSVGGTCHFVSCFNSLNETFGNLEVFRSGNKIVSRVEGVSGNVIESDITNPHQLGDIELAILPGVFGVAENAAIWLDMDCLGSHRAVFVIPQHLILVLRAEQIVPTMHEAYERFNLNEHNFGVFISGPSKTADIEQSLVIGAHGARSCTVFLVS